MTGRSGRRAIAIGVMLVAVIGAVSFAVVQGHAAVARHAGHEAGLELESTGGTTLVTDAAHRRTGIDPSKPAPNDFQEIPDSSFTPVMDTDSIFLGDPATYTAVTTVTPPGGIVDMTLDRYVNWRIVQTATFLALGVTRGSKLTLRLPKGSQLSDLRLRVDLGGNGTIEETLSPFVTSGATKDSTNPTTMVGANQDGARTSRVTMVAHDTGSGVGATYYWVGKGALPKTYTKPFDAPIGSKIPFQSVDKAGNLEYPRWLVVDDASNERALAAAVPIGTPLRRFIDPQGDEDWFTFRADGRSTYSVGLSALPADYDLELVDASGNLVGAGQKRGLDPEEVRMQLAAGTYYVHVLGNASLTGKQRPWDHVHPYVLTVRQVG